MSTVFANGLDPDRYRSVRGLLSEAVGRSRELGLELLTLRIDADDLSTLSAAEDEGFSLVDRENVYTARAGASPPTVGARGSDEVSVSIHEDGSSFEVSEADRCRLVERAARFDISHFGLDELIPTQSTAGMYRAWTSNVLDGNLGDIVAIARCRDRVVGFFAGSRDQDLQRRHGVDLLNQIWSVVSQEGLGVFEALASAVYYRMNGSNGWIECETQRANVAVNRAMTKLTGAGPKTACWSLHRWV